jgi:hypothetical protein
MNANGYEAHAANRISKGTLIPNDWKELMTFEQTVTELRGFNPAGTS